MGRLYRARCLQLVGVSTPLLRFPKSRVDNGKAYGGGGVSGSWEYDKPKKTTPKIQKPKREVVKPSLPKAREQRPLRSRSPRRGRFRPMAINLNWMHKGGRYAPVVSCDWIAHRAGTRTRNATRAGRTVRIVIMAATLSADSLAAPKKRSTYSHRMQISTGAVMQSLKMNGGAT